MLYTSTRAALLLGLVGLAGCASSGYELATLSELTQFYGGGASVKRGYNFVAEPDAPQGSYLEITLDSPGLSQRYDDLALPASNCAYLAYHNLSVAAPQRYNYFTVNIIDSTTTRTFTYPAAELALAEQAADNLVTLVADWQQHELLAAAGTFNPVGLGPTSPDSLLPLMLRVSARLAPLTRYHTEGFALVNLPDSSRPDAGQPKQLVRLVLSVPHPANQVPGVFAVAINPALRANQQFLYGLRLLR